VPALARFFLQKSAKELGVEAKRITEAALARLTRFEFPGNVRQLENICHWLTVMAPAQMIEAKDLPPELQAAPASSVAAAVPVAAPMLAEAAAGQAAASGKQAAAEAPPQAAPGAVPAAVAANWLAGLEQDARSLLLAGQPEVWDTLTRKFEAQLIHTALEITRGRRIEAAQKLGIGRNTITRKIQELGLDD
jgi:two-component system, NtrC family, nitrogen regulation response regulator GlnG